MDRIKRFESEQRRIRELDLVGHASGTEVMYRQYQLRNSFGLDPTKQIHRIFQGPFYERDVADGYLTLPLATASVWNDPLENPLADVQGVDRETGLPIHLGSVVSSCFSLCWTQRPVSTEKDWASFSHGRPAVRVTSTVGKLMNRVMRLDDAFYMHRAWLIDVQYKDPGIIQAMKDPAEVYARLESTGALIAASAAVVRTSFSDEDEVRLLFDASIKPSRQDLILLQNPLLVRIPFDWTDFTDKEVFRP